MTMTEGNVTSADIAAAVEKGVAAGVKAATATMAPPTVPAETKRTSAYDALMAEIEAADADKETLELHKRIHSAIKADVKAEVLEEATKANWQTLVAQREASAIGFLQKEIATRYSDVDKEDRGKIVEIITNSIAGEAKKDVNLLNRIASGEGCEKELEALVEKHSADFDKLTKRETRTTAAGKAPAGLSSGASGAQASTAAAKGEETIDEKSLTGPQREWFYETKKQAQSVGMSEAEATKYAFSRARNIPK